jgi:hypothetical protein
VQNGSGASQNQYEVRRNCEQAWTSHDFFLSFEGETMGKDTERSDIDCSKIPAQGNKKK